MKVGFNMLRSMPNVHVAAPSGLCFVCDESRVREMVSDGEVSAESLYWVKGMPAWRPLKELIAPEASESAEISDEPPPLPANWPPAEPRKPVSKPAVAALVCAGVAWAAALIIKFGDLPNSFLGWFLLTSLFTAIGALGCAVSASWQIKDSGDALEGRGLIAATWLLVGFLFVWSVVISPNYRPHSLAHHRTVHGNTIRQIGQASLIYANDNHEVLPPPVIIENGWQRSTTIHDVAKWLAQGGGLNDASLWFYSKDEALTKEAQTLHGPVLAPDREHLHPDFAKQNVFSYDYLTGLHVDHPVRTPIAWTRGLQPDGTWDSDGVFGTEGGHIVFLGGNVSFYRNLKGSDGSGVLIDTNGNPTANILDVMPPGTRIVGGGPGSLNGYFKPAEGRTD